MTAAPPARSSDRIDVGLVLLLTLLVALGPLSISFYIPSLPAIGRALDADAALVQKTLTVYLVGFAVAQLVFGPLSDRYGRRPVMLVGLVMYIVATLFCAAAWSVEALLVGRFVQGVAACVAPVVGRAVVRDMFEGKAAVKAFSLLGSAIALAPAAGPALGGLIQEAFGWQANFLALALMAVIITAAVGTRLGETNRERVMDALQPRRLMQIYGGLLSNRAYMAHVAAVSMAFCGLFAYTADAPFLFITGLGVAEGVFGFLIVFTVGAYVAGNMLASRLIASGRAGGPALIRAGLVLQLVGGGVMLALSAELSLVRVIAPMMLYMVGFGMILPPGFAGALQPFPRVAGSASALMGCLQMGMGAVASAAAAFLFAGSAWSLALILLVGAVLGLVAFLALHRAERAGVP